MATDERFDVPLYTVREAARHLDVPTSTFRDGVHGYQRRLENVARILHKLDTTADARQSPGPFVYRVHPTRIERLILAS